MVDCEGEFSDIGMKWKFDKKKSHCSGICVRRHEDSCQVHVNQLIISRQQRRVLAFKRWLVESVDARDVGMKAYARILWSLESSDSEEH